MNPERFFSFHMNSDLDGGEFSAQTKAQELIFFFLSLSFSFQGISLRLLEIEIFTPAI